MATAGAIVSYYRCIYMVSGMHHSPITTGEENRHCSNIREDEELEIRIKRQRVRLIFES